jgi:hypothetical protein
MCSGAMKQHLSHTLLDSVRLTAVLAAAGAAVLLWTPVLVIWTTVAAFRQRVMRRAGSQRHLSPVG